MEDRSCPISGTSLTMRLWHTIGMWQAKKFNALYVWDKEDYECVSEAMDTMESHCEEDL